MAVLMDELLEDWAARVEGTPRYLNCDADHIAQKRGEQNAPARTLTLGRNRSGASSFAVPGR